MCHFNCNPLLSSPLHLLLICFLLQGFMPLPHLGILGLMSIFSAATGDTLDDDLASHGSFPMPLADPAARRRCIQNTSPTITAMMTILPTPAPIPMYSFFLAAGLILVSVLLLLP